MSTNTAFDLLKLYKTYFANSPYFVSPKDSQEPTTKEIGYSITTENPRPQGSIDYSSKNIAFNKIGAYGQAIWFPITLKTTIKKGSQTETIQIEIEACTVGVNLMKELIRTPVSERKGKVKECFAIDDYRFTIKGFLIGKNRLVPEEQISRLKKIFESTEYVELHGGYPEIFLEDSCHVAISTLDFPEVQGKAVWIRPFTMTLETDYIEDLIIK
ncbi:DUF6046 domain-containing protein [Flavobacterium sp. AC]|uniref:DUF6046 domain-containing protein n=1 Tax=Flavobacterium azizsancarii TaxID=2961580 RepID=A0ABT4WHX1_9FLAO|nr:DUF6046 domain-containing protein [Flavobacterium azizsancarii]MDA6072088.1 DUF6046 domain-containing protein [Flavobacterium azizsancarii]